MSKSLPNRFQAFGLCLIVLVLLANSRLWEAHLWAEDGAVFLPESLELGLASIFRPHFGYYQLVPRLLFYVLLVFPLQAFAFLLTASCTVIYALAVSKFAEEDYRWLVSSDRMRTGLCLTTCFLPGLHEVLGNAANLHTVLFIYLALVAWKDPDRSLSWFEVMAAFFCGGSEGAVIVLLPVFGYRIWYKWRTHGVGVSREVVLTVILVMWSAANYLEARSAEHGGLFQIKMIEPVLLGISTVRLIAERLTVFALLGPGFIRSTRAHDGWRVAAVGLPMLALLIGVLVRRYRSKSLLVLSVPICVLGTYVLTWLVRTNSLQVMLEHTPLGRYALASGPFAIALWLSCAESAGRWKYALGIVLLALSVAVNWRFKLDGPAGSQRNWPATASILQEALRAPAPQRLELAINPDGHAIRYTPSVRPR